MKFTTLAVLTVALASAQSPSSVWPRATPESQGMDSAALAQLDRDIAGGKYGNVDSILILRHGRTVMDQTYRHDYRALYGAQSRIAGPLNAHEPSGPFNYFNPWWHPFYRGGDLHTLQSVTKTVASVVIGVAITRKEFPSIDTPVLQFFDAAKVQNVDARKRRMTIRHLLTMTAGFDWNESLPYSDPNNAASLMEASPDWVRFTIDRPMALEPGEKFNYSSGVSELLAHIFFVATGQDMEEYAARYLFAPLGIERYFWKRTPTGLLDSEGGLYLDRHDLAKVADLYHHNGLWQGKRLVDEAWVQASLAPSVTVSETSGVKYGFKWWLYPYAKDDPRVAFGGSGFGGQIPLVLPDYDIVLVVNAWNVDNGKRLGAAEAIRRVIEAVKTR
jgi:CubicO group peptidase (beta-lactamase class C family)